MKSEEEYIVNDEDCIINIDTGEVFPIPYTAKNILIAYGYIFFDNIKNIYYFEDKNLNEIIEEIEYDEKRNKK